MAKKDSTPKPENNQPSARDNLDPIAVRKFHDATEAGTVAGETATMLKQMSESAARKRRSLISNLEMLVKTVNSQIIALKEYPDTMPDNGWVIGTSAREIDKIIAELALYAELAQPGNEILRLHSEGGRDE